MGSKYDALNKESIIEDYRNGCSIRDICAKYGIKSKKWVSNIIGENVRGRSESIANSHKRHPEKYFHNEETKEKIRKHRIKFLKEHPEETAWRKRNEPSYPEQCFIKLLKNYGYDKKHLIEREFPVFPYYIDFAFVSEKLAVEIDGSQHILNEDRKEKDEKKRFAFAVEWVEGFKNIRKCCKNRLEWGGKGDRFNALQFSAKSSKVRYFHS